jgi:glycosyltransferase involved in cell wall biosynthesis
VATGLINVLDLRDTHEIGGPGKTILETFRAIDTNRFRLHLGVFGSSNARNESPFFAAAKAMDVPIHEIDASGPYDLGQILRLRKLVHEQRIDIVHPHETSSDVITYAMSKITRVPIVTTAHGWIANSAKQRAMVALDKRVMRGFDSVIAVSRRIEQDLLDAGVPKKQVCLLHNAIVVENYRRQDGGGILESFVGKRLSHPVLVSIGRLSPEKGHADLVDALRIVAARGRRIEAVIAGDGPSRKDLIERIAAAGLQASIHLPGYVNAPARLLQDADLMVLPSHTEGLPNAALEALVMNVPVLATKVGGTPEVVIDGETGRLVASRQPEALAGGIIEFLDHRAKWQEWADRGRKMVEEQFDFKARTRRLEHLYESLASGASEKSQPIGRL